MYVASMRVIGGQRVLLTWLVLCYLVQMWGDLCLAPVGLGLALVSSGQLTSPREGVYMMVVGVRSRRFIR